MNRRGFLAGLGALVGGVLLDQAIPLGRVWSFPAEVKCLNAEPLVYPLNHLATIWYDREALDLLAKNLRFVEVGHQMSLPMRQGRKISMFRYAA